MKDRVTVTVFGSSPRMLTQWEAAHVIHWLCSFKWHESTWIMFPQVICIHVSLLFLLKHPEGLKWSGRSDDSLHSDSVCLNAVWWIFLTFLNWETHPVFILHNSVCYAGHNEERLFHRAEQESTDIFCKWAEQTVTATLQSDTFRFVPSDLLPSYCLACILCFSCTVLLSLWDSLAGMSSNSASFSLHLLGNFTPQTDDGLRWRTGSEFARPDHTDVPSSRVSHPSLFGKYQPSLQTLKPFRWSSPQSVSLTTWSTLLFWHVEPTNLFFHWV